MTFRFPWQVYTWVVDRLFEESTNWRFPNLLAFRLDPSVVLMVQKQELAICDLIFDSNRDWLWILATRNRQATSGAALSSNEIMLVR